MQKLHGFALVLCALVHWTIDAAICPARSIGSSRLALVIGNATYLHTTPLANPRNDAVDIAAALERLGFTVTTGLDLDKAGMDETIRRFADALGGATTGVLFYAGHGLQVDGQNYLVPVDARLETAASLDFELVRLDLIQRTMERQVPTNILFLDACRDNPLTRNLARSLGTRSSAIGRGLAATESGVGTLISYSTQPGNVARDGSGRNSPFAKALVEQLLIGRDDLSDMLIQVRRNVMQETSNRQVPWEHSALTDKFRFTSPAEAAEPVRNELSYEKQIELALWAAVKDSPDPNVLRSYLDRYPDGTFAPAARAIVAGLTVKSGIAPPTSGPPADARMPFDGRWRVLKDIPSCYKRPRSEFVIEVRNGQVVNTDVKGTILGNGAVNLEVRPGDGTVGLFSGRLNGDGGQVLFKGMVKNGGVLGCSGVAMLTRLEPETGVSGVAPTGEEAGEPKALPQMLQQELRRVGCYDGAIDGEWGAASRSALARFNERTGATLATQRPDARAVEAVRKTATKVCGGTDRNAGALQPAPSARKTRTCRQETLPECRKRHCPGGGCGLRGTGTCAPINRRQICN